MRENLHFTLHSEHDPGGKNAILAYRSCKAIPLHFIHTGAYYDYTKALVYVFCYKMPHEK